jgi:hypothetical protein
MEFNNNNNEIGERDHEAMRDDPMLDPHGQEGDNAIAAGNEPSGDDEDAMSVDDNSSVSVDDDSVGALPDDVPGVHGALTSASVGFLNEVQNQDRNADLTMQLIGIAFDRATMEYLIEQLLLQRSLQLEFGLEAFVAVLPVVRTSRVEPR